MASQRYDFVLFGATSFVGKIVARFLVRQYNNGAVRWAAAGRSLAKLESLKSELGPEAAGLDLLVADASDENALVSICEATRVVVSTVGPYALYGEPLVKTCAETGTDYCDITGEVQWVGRMIKKYETTAQASGARIVHCCGFDSIPSDLGVLHLQTEANATLGTYCSRIKMRVRRMKGEFSGGTVASLLNVVEEASKSPQVRMDLADPYSLCPPGHPFSERQPEIRSPRYDRDFQCWVAPFIMAGVNTRIVHRSNALSAAAWGTHFRYDEGTMVGKGAGGLLRSATLSAVMSGFMVAAALPPSRWALQRFVIPKPGEGPSEESQFKGNFDIRLFGATDGGQAISTRVTGDRDPGYGSTAKMLAEAAICLALDIPQTQKPGGF